VSHSKMKHVELHAHYLRKLVHEDVVSLEYCRTKDQVVDIFTKLLVEARFIKLHTFLRLQEDAIMGECSGDVISPPEPSELCDDVGVSEHKVLMVHDTSLGFSRSRGRPTFGHNHSGDRPAHHTSRSGSRRPYRLDSRPIVEDSQVVDRPTLQLTTSWMDSWSD
jgi:hypothetical protein